LLCLPWGRIINCMRPNITQDKVVLVGLQQAETESIMIS